MPALDPLLVCIVAAALVLLAHGIFALATRGSTERGSGTLAEGAAILLCGLALLAPLAIVPFANGLNETLILLGTVFAVIASSVPIVVLPRRRGATDSSPPPLIADRRVVPRRRPPGPVRVVVRPGTDPAQVVRTVITGPLPRIPTTAEEAAPDPAATPDTGVAGPARWVPPPVERPAPEPPTESAEPELPLPPLLKEADDAVKALDEVDGVVLDVKTWLRLDR